MLSGGRSKRRLRESPCLQGQAPAATATDQGTNAQSKKTLQLSVPQNAAAVPKYYPGTSIPVNGWFHACKVCRCWTAFSASSTSGTAVPLCRRCATRNVKDRNIKSVTDSDTVDAVACISATASADNRPADVQSHPAPAAAPASLTDCQSPSALCAAATSAPATQPTHGLPQQHNKPGSLQYMLAPNKQTATGAPLAATQLKQPTATAASTDTIDMEGLTQLPNTLSELMMTYASSSEQLMPTAWQQQQQQQQWIPRQWSQDLNAEPHCKSRRCSDMGPTRTRSIPQRPFFPSQSGYGNSAPNTTRPSTAAAAAAATLDSNHLVLSARGDDNMELLDTSMDIPNAAMHQSAASALVALTAVGDLPSQQAYQYPEQVQQQPQSMIEYSAVAGSIGQWYSDKVAQVGLGWLQQQPCAASYQPAQLQQMPHYQSLLCQEEVTHDVQQQKQQQEMMGEQYMYCQHMPQQHQQQPVVLGEQFMYHQHLY